MSIPPLENPLAGHRFIVSLDPTDAYLQGPQAALVTLMAAGGFSDVVGLSATLTVLEFGEGGRNDYTHILPVRHKYPKIVLSRGVVRDLGLLFWYQAGLTESIGSRRDGAIILLSQLGIPAMAWVFRNGLATGWNGPTFKAGAQAVAVESIEITHEGLVQVPLSPPGTP